MAYEIEFVNHASVLISHQSTGLLTDPWYNGDAFHKGWNLIVEGERRDIEDVLARTTHIWISHEHPDHFSPRFFADYGDLLRERAIPVLFQETDDRRVAGFLAGRGLEVIELAFGRPHRLADDVSVTCLKDDFYDSALSVKAGDSHILNLNDCAVTTEARAREIRGAVGTCDVLLTQFSYAAWKGGRENRAWREAAAAAKLAASSVQARVLEPSVVIPFASFVFFSNERNFYLNDAINTPRGVAAHFAGAPFALATMKPGDRISGTPDAEAGEAALRYWDGLYGALEARPLLRYETRSFDELEVEFGRYRDRVYRANARWFMRLARAISPIAVFEPVVIELDDLGETVEVDIAAGSFARSDSPPDLQMGSESLWFLFRNTFGFDTLTVNGCLEERRAGGFARAAKSLAIENLNNLGLPFAPSLLFRGKLIAIFLRRLFAVRRKLRGEEAGQT